MSIPALLARTVVGLTRTCLRPTLRMQCLARNTLLTTTSPLQGLALRFYGRNEDCAKDVSPRCSPKSIAKSPCMKRKKKEAKKKKPSPFKSMWANPECCRDPCPDVLPRFDELYYKPSNKAKRKYQMTWVPCPKIKILPRKVCCFNQLKKPKIKKRKPKHKPKTACSPQPECKDKRSKRCPKIRLPRCRGVRDPPKCKTERGPSNCKKVCTPYPAFSECKKPKIKPPRPIECDCLKVRSMCTAWNYLRKMGLKK